MSLILSILYFLGSWILRLFALGALFLFALSVFYEIATYKKKKEIKTTSFLISIGASVMILLVVRFLALRGSAAFATRFWWFWSIIVPLIGLGLGVFLGFSRKLEKQGDKVYIQGTFWHTLIWAVTVIVLQLVYILNLFRSLSPVFAFMFAGTALLVGTNIMLILKANKLKKPPAPVPQAPPAPAPQT